MGEEKYESVSRQSEAQTHHVSISPTEDRSISAGKVGEDKDTEEGVARGGRSAEQLAGLLGSSDAGKNTSRHVLWMNFLVSISRPRTRPPVVFLHERKLGAVSPKLNNIRRARGIRVEKMPHFRLAGNVTVDSLLHLAIRFCLPLMLT